MVKGFESLVPLRPPPPTSTTHNITPHNSTAPTTQDKTHNTIHTSNVTFQVAIGVHDEVFWFDVAMNDIVGVQVLERRGSIHTQCNVMMVNVCDCESLLAMHLFNSHTHAGDGDTTYFQCFYDLAGIETGHLLRKCTPHVQRAVRVPCVYHVQSHGCESVCVCRELEAA